MNYYTFCKYLYFLVFRGLTWRIQIACQLHSTIQYHTRFYVLYRVLYNKDIIIQYNNENSFCNVCVMRLIPASDRLL